MKKLILSLTLVAALGTAALAQAPVKFGVKAGVAFPNMTLSAMGTSISFDTKTSFYVGGTANFEISDYFSFQPGLTFISKGTKISGASDPFGDGSIETESGSINSSYLEVPVNLLATLPAGASGKVFFGGGPYYGLALSANAKSGGVKEDITIGSGDGNFKRSDFGVNFLAGFELKNGLNIHAGYGLGLSSVIESSEDVDLKFKNKVFSVGLGFSF